MPVVVALDDSDGERVAVCVTLCSCVGDIVGDIVGDMRDVVSDGDSVGEDDCVAVPVELREREPEKEGDCVWVWLPDGVREAVTLGVGDGDILCV